MHTIIAYEAADGFSWRVALEFKIQDLWIGAYWKSAEIAGGASGKVVDLWICALPCLPLHFTFRRCA